MLMLSVGSNEGGSVNQPKCQQHRVLQRFASVSIQSSVGLKETSYIVRTNCSSGARHNFNQPVFCFFYLFREDPFRTKNQRDAWSLYQAVTMSLATNWLCRNALDRNGSSQTCCLAAPYDRLLKGTLQ